MYSEYNNSSNNINNGSCIEDINEIIIRNKNNEKDKNSNQINSLKNKVLDNIGVFVFFKAFYYTILHKSIDNKSINELVKHIVFDYINIEFNQFEEIYLKTASKSSINQLKFKKLL